MLRLVSKYSLLHTFLPADVELRYHTLGPEVRASLAVWRSLLASALDLRLATVDLQASSAPSEFQHGNSYVKQTPEVGGTYDRLLACYCSCLE